MTPPERARTPAERARQRAQELVERLRAEGRDQDAQIVATLVKSSATSTSNNALLWADNMELRDRLGMKKRGDAEAPPIGVT